MNLLPLERAPSGEEVEVLRPKRGWSAPKRRGERPTEQGSAHASANLVPPLWAEEVEAGWAERRANHRLNILLSLQFAQPFPRGTTKSSFAPRLVITV